MRRSNLAIATISHFHPSLIFKGKARPVRDCTQMLDSWQQSSLLRYGIDYGNNKFLVHYQGLMIQNFFSFIITYVHNKLEYLSQDSISSLIFAGKARNLPESGTP